MRIMKNIVLTLLFMIFSCSHGVFSKPSSGLIKDYVGVIFDNHKYYCIEELPIKSDLVFELVDSKSKATPWTYYQVLDGQHIATRRSVYESSSNRTSSFTVGKVSLLIDSTCVGKLGIKTLKELKEYLIKDRNLDSLGVKFILDFSPSKLLSSPSKSLLGTQCIVFDYNGLISFKDSIDKKKSDINLTLNLANKDLQSNMYYLSPKTYDKYIDTENKFVDSKRQDKNDFYFKIQGNVEGLLSALEGILRKVKKGEL
ncbi:hypothetical protein [Borrelia hermsii]|uniref:Lipoprotein n=1 Tax=Borrelia hermsii MTW TaxID=1313291 RepID=W5T5H6_BORHE|nr:hypothetical protein [Borrelia hermsii]AHH14374.1 Hypothetical protein BHW_0015000 [Borrelia hermsii MTW]